MIKVVAVFPKYSAVEETGRKLVDNDLADYSLMELGLDYEKQLRQEIFIRSKEINLMILGAAVGMLGIGLVFYLLSLPHNLGILLGRLLAGGLPVVILTGAGIGLAAGGLLAGIYCLSLPFVENYSGYWLISLFCQETKKEKALKIIKEHGGIFPV